MKKFISPLSFFLSLFLLGGLVSPAALADGQEVPFSVEAAAAILIDADTGEVLYEQAPDERRFPASITKVMTGLLTVEAVERGELTLETTVTLSDTLYTGIGWGGSTRGRFSPFGTFSTVPLSLRPTRPATPWLKPYPAVSPPLWN